MVGNRQTALQNLAKAGKSPGRPKGSKGKFTKLRDDFLRAFYDKRIGGHKLLVEMLQNPKERAVIIQIIGRMLPRYTDIKHHGDGLTVVIRALDIKKKKPAKRVAPAVSSQIEYTQEANQADDINDGKS